MPMSMKILTTLWKQLHGISVSRNIIPSVVKDWPKALILWIVFVKLKPIDRLQRVLTIRTTIWTVRSSRTLFEDWSSWNVPRTAIRENPLRGMMRIIDDVHLFSDEIRCIFQDEVIIKQFSHIFCFCDDGQRATLYKSITLWPVATHP